MILRYPGGKSKKSIREQIFSHAPKKYTEYREPFVGGAGIYFNVDPTIARWINDIDANLMCVYAALLNRPEAFIKACREIDAHNKLEKVPAPEYNIRLKAKFKELAFDDTQDEALRFYFVNRTVWLGRVNYDLPSRLYFSNPQGWNIVFTDALEKAACILKGTKVTCGDYSMLLEYPGTDVWIYVDPPYFKNTNLDKRSQLYANNFTIDDHIKLAERVKTCSHKVLISYDNEPFIKDLYKDFNIHETKWTYCGTSSARHQSKNKRQGQELIITNYA